MALRGVSLQVGGEGKGVFLAVMGASGSGKSTLLHLMAGLTQADEGEVQVSGVNLTSMSDQELTLFRRRRIGIVFQAFNLIPTLTALENVLLPLMLDGKDGAAERKRAEALLQELNLGHRLSHRPDALSGGEQQRVAIARALVTDPQVILADEPTGNLDSVNSEVVCGLLRSLAEDRGKTVVMVTHEPSVAAWANEVAVLKDGKLIKRFETPQSGNEREASLVASMYQEAVAS